MRPPNPLNPHGDFRAKKPFKVAPKIEDSFTDDNGVECYVLDSGNTIPVDTYNSLWNLKKGTVLPKNQK